MAITKPTVGRKVWYRICENDKRGAVPMNCVPGHPLDATIIAVWSDRMINVLVTDIVGHQFPVLSVDLLHPGDEPRKDNNGEVIGRYCEWMPYQVTQHAKQAEQEAPVPGSTADVVLTDGKDV